MESTSIFDNLKTGDYLEVKLAEKTQYNNNCYIFRFDFADPNKCLGIIYGNHIKLK